MTTKERVIVSAYTGIRMCDMDLIEAYVQEKLGRPVLSNEWGISVSTRLYKLWSQRTF